MPELPEVQTIVNDLKDRLIGRKIVDVWFDAPQILKKLKSPTIFRTVVGEKIVGIRRRGKNILFDMNHDFMMLVHLRMTGHLLLGKWDIVNDRVVAIHPDVIKEKINSYIHVLFSLDNGIMLGLSDARKFAKVVVGKKEVVESELINLGPEPLGGLSFLYFKDLIGGGRKIKQVLLDQNVIAGIGNIYADEILYSACVHPKTIANTLDDDQKRLLFTAMKKILTKAIALRGASLNDYRDLSGKKGSYMNSRLVYGKHRELCIRCSWKIERVKIGGRSAHFCPKCQKV